MQLNDFDNQTGQLVKVTQEDPNGGPGLGEVGVAALGGDYDLVYVFPTSAVAEWDDGSSPTTEELHSGGGTRPLPALRMEPVPVTSTAVSDVVIVRHEMTMWNERFEYGPFLLIPVASRADGNKVAEDIRKNARPKWAMEVEVRVESLEGLPGDASYAHAWDLIRGQALTYIDDFEH